jgi:hypothetical protein
LLDPALSSPVGWRTRASTALTRPSSAAMRLTARRARSGPGREACGRGVASPTLSACPGTHSDSSIAAMKTARTPRCF